MSAITGVRAAIGSKSSIVNGRPNSRAIASRCSSPFVEPPVATIDAAAFSIASQRDDLRGADVAADEIHHDPAALRGSGVLVGESAGMAFSPDGLIPRNSRIVDIVFAVNCPPQAPAPGHATDSSSCRSAAQILPTAWPPIAS